MSNYEDSGFDAFLSRSIDDLSQGNLDSAGPVSTQMRYDSAQSSGYVGDKFAVGNVLINGNEGAIELLDNRLKTLLVGKDSENRQVVKVAKEGFDAKTARDDELTFNSLQNNLKVVVTDSVLVTAGATPTNWATVPHNLGFAPIPLAFLNNVNLSGIAVGANIPLPTYTNLAVDTVGQQVIMRTWLHALADEKNLYIVAFNSTGASFNINVKYYLLQESAA